MEIKQEDLSDLPLLSHIIRQSSLGAFVDTHYPKHGNWGSPISMGQMIEIWLLYIISECDHKMYTVADWAQRHIGILRYLTGCDYLEANCFHDDRLGLILEKLSDMALFQAFMGDYNRQLLRIYELPQSVVRLDSFNAPSYREEQKDGLFRFGYHKSHQIHEPHMKVMAACIDPLALPIAMISVPGSISDDELYLPAIEQAQRSVSGDGLVYVGDVKMGSIPVLTQLATSNNFYLCPLSNAALPKGALVEGIKSAQSAVQSELRIIYNRDEGTKKQAIAKIFELPVVTKNDGSTSTSWLERRILVLSLPYAEAQEKKLRDALQTAQEAIRERFTPKKHAKRWKGGQEQQALAFVDSVLKKKRVGAYLSVELLADKEHPAQTPLGINIQLDQKALDEKIATMGWRIYVTNVPVAQMSAEDVLWCYRDEYLIEHQFHKILTKTTALLPIFLKKDSRCIALVHLVFIAIQFISIIQFRVRSTLKETGESLRDLIPGNKNRAVKEPTAELLLKRFKGICAVSVTLKGQNTATSVLNLDPIHQKILHLLKCPDDLYEKYAQNCFHTP